MTRQNSDPVSETILKIRKRIIRLKDRKENIGEENTKAVLIDPILQALGWNIGELEEVCREYRRQSKDNPVDYALFLLRKERLFIEAKALEKDINDHKWILQTLSYATAVGVEWCVLTNGDEYRLYNSLAPVPAEEKLFRKFLISNEVEHGECIETLKLISKERMGENILEALWRAHFIDRNVKKALLNILSNESKSIIRLIKKCTQGIGPTEIRDSLKRADFHIEFPIIPLIDDPPPIAGSDRKTSIRNIKKDNPISRLVSTNINFPLNLEADYKGVSSAESVGQITLREFPQRMK